ncbi:hypothetical protein [Dactylosporangium sp. NPDC048998]|uniref:hypothetical protein n=1 Tax=Dactylosporangium sp. NPDC048998 TaxID=3363976 RepID=UPI00371A34FF
MDVLPPTLIAFGIITIGTAGPRLRHPAPDQVAVMAKQALLGDAPHRRAAAIAALRGTDLPTALRGYRKDEVDRYISQLCTELTR